MPDALRALSLSLTVLTVAAFFLGTTVAALAAGFALQRWMPQRRIFAVPLFPGQHRFELAGNAVFLAVMIAAFSWALRAELIRFGPSSAARNGLTFVALMLGFQVYYWCLHRAMHTRSLVRFHRWHHRSQVTTPLTGQSVSFVEALGWAVGYLGLPWILSHAAPIGFWGWVGYMAFNINGNIVGHANTDPTAPFAATRAATWFANAFVYHALHHARWNGHYSFQSAMMDRLMGTEWADWPALYDRVASGHPLENLKVRGNSEESTA